MPRFKVRNTFEIPDRKLFVLAGTVVEGEIHVGMFVHIPQNPAMEISARIHSIEFARRRGTEDVCLCIESDSKLAKAIRALSIAGETFTIATDRAAYCYDAEGPFSER